MSGRIVVALRGRIAVAAQGRWLAMREGRLTGVTPGDDVVVVDDAGVENVTIPPRLDTPDLPTTAALLASRCDPKHDGWLLQMAAHSATAVLRNDRVMIGMLARSKLPGFDGGDALGERLLIAEQAVESLAQAGGAK